MLVNSVGSACVTSIVATTEDDFALLVDVNVRDLIFSTHRAAEHMRESGDPDASLTAFGMEQPQGRTGCPSEIASAVLFLASGATASVTGTELIVDGGISAG